MKNRKIIPLTVAIVAVVLMGVVGMSKIFETLWQRENTVDNTLDAEIVENIGSVFDYPYVHLKDISDDEIQFLWLHGVPEFAISVSEGMISYQQATNISGEALKYLYGCTEHQSANSIIGLIDLSSLYADRDFELYKDKRYLCSFGIRYGENESFYFQCTIDPYTGEIMQCSARDFRNRAELDRDMSYTDVPEITESYRQNITSKAQDAIDVLNPGAKIKELIKLEYYTNISRGRVLSANIELTDGTLLMMEFDVQYENNNQLVGYYTPYTSAMEEQLK